MVLQLYLKESSSIRLQENYKSTRCLQVQNNDSVLEYERKAKSEAMTKRERYRNKLERERYKLQYQSICGTLCRTDYNLQVHNHEIIGCVHAREI